MITTKNVGFSIQGKSLLKDISTQFLPNEISMIIGPNGAGKSTLIKLLTQQIKCSKGQISFEDQNLGSMKKASLAQVRAVLSQNLELTFPLSVMEVVMMGRFPHFAHKPKEQDKDICQKALQFFNLEKLIDRNFQTLSGGEKQRVHFARVAAQIWPDDNPETKYLFLDEPLTYLDIYYQYNFMNSVKELMTKQKMVVVGVVHDLHLAYKYADHSVLLNEGKVVAQGKRGKVITKENILNVFQIDSNILSNEKGDTFLVHQAHHSS